MGKTNVPELCADFQTDAWDGRCTAGGAVVIAARLSPLELGSGIGGSVKNRSATTASFR